MVISAEPQRPSDPVVAEGGGAVAAAAEGGDAAKARRGLSSSLKTWGSHRVLRCAPVNRAGDAISPAASRRSSPEELGAVREKLLLSLRDVAAHGHGGSSSSAAAAAATDGEVFSAEAPPPPPWKLRTRRRRQAMAPAAVASASPSSERRAARAVRADALDRPRFSATLSADEIEEDVYALTGARPRRRPRRRPRAVQKQLDSLFPGAWLSEITVESYRVPDDR